MLIRPLLAFIVLVPFAVALGAEDAKQKENLDGTWLPESAELAGKPYPEQIRKSIKLVIDGEQYTVTVGQGVDKGTVKLNAAATPKQLDITGTEGPNKGKTILAIYEHDGDMLKICYDLSGKSRPTEFKTTEGSQLFLVSYKRDTPK